MNLETEVKEIIKSHLEENPYFINEVMQHGCISGIVSELIYYNDTCAFYERHKEEIQEMLNDFDIEPIDLRGFDKTDKLILETHNQNLLAWVAFEEMTRIVGLELDYYFQAQYDAQPFQH